MKRLDINQLATFVTIVDAGNITKAAIVLHRTQAAVSIQLKKLEEVAGKSLLNRGYNQFTLTREGEVLLSYAHKILSLSEEALNLINDDDLEGVVRFGIPDGYARAFIQRPLRQFIDRFPKVKIQIKNDNSHNLYKSLHAGELDLILVTHDPLESGGDLIRREKICWVKAKDLTLDMSKPLPLALYEQGCSYRKGIIDALNHVELDWFVSFECQGVTGFDIAISNGLAISALAESLVKEEWSIIKPASNLPDLGEVEIALHTRPGEIDEAIRCFSQVLVESISNIAIKS